jgi:O-antigen/teichoic acid export membrane protein
MSLGRNIIANFGGQAMTTVVALVTVPLYLKLLGNEGYGLVSLLLVLQAVTAVLDLGLSTTANREVANYIATDRPVADRRTLIRTLETFYFAAAAAILMAFAGLSPWLARKLFTAEYFPVETVKACLFIAGASIALRWPASLYQGILRGTEQQVSLNVIVSSVAALRGLGSILVLAFVSRTVLAFYWAQLAFSIVEVVLSAAATKRWGLGFSGVGGRFDRALLTRLWRFSLNVGGLSIFALILKQFDKMAISAMLPLSALGFYNAASIASNGLTKISTPVQAAVFPRLTSQHQRRADPELARTFHGAVQGIAFLTAPLSFVLIFFHHDVLLLWTRNAELASAAGPALAVLSAGILFNTMMSVVFSLLLASGLTGLPLAMNGGGALVLAPLTYWLVHTNGITGAAIAWLIFNIANYLIVPPIMFRRVLVGEYRAWLVHDTLPFVVVPLVCFAVAWRLSGGNSLLIKGIAITIAGIVYTAVLLAINPLVRQVFRNVRRRMIGRPAELSAPSSVR